MSFLHLSLLAGLAVVTIPVMMHLFGQRQPQLIDFPALRFVRETSQEQSTSWQLRHMLLLLLRVLLLAALALALARPRVHSANLGSMLGVSGVGLLAVLASLIAVVAWASKRPASIWMTCGVVAAALWVSAGLWGYQALAGGPVVPVADQSAPVAAALIIDNGPTMSYRADNEVRLDVAKEMSRWILDQLPADSRVGVLSGVPVGSLALDPATAESQVKLIELRGAHVDLLARIRTALDLVLASELQRKEIYVVTDLMAASWAAASTDLKDMLSEYQGEVLVQIIDVGKQDRANWQLGDPRLDYQSVPAGSEVIIEIDVQRSAESSGASTATVELLQEELDPTLPVLRDGELSTAPIKVVDREVVELQQQDLKTITLRARVPAPGTHHFSIRLDRNDPLGIDNERFVTVVASQQQPALSVAEDNGLARMLKLISDPGAEAATGDGGAAAQLNYRQLSQADLSGYAVVTLLDPPPMNDRDVQRLKEFVEQGGGLFVVMGPALGSLDSIRGNPLLELFPGELGTIIARPAGNRNVFLELAAISHPAFQSLTGVDVPWQFYPVFRNWSFENLADNVLTLAKFSDGAPAMLSQVVGRGQIITLATTVPQVDRRDVPVWNELWIADENWPAFALLSGTIQALSGGSADNLNVTVGATVGLSNDSALWPTRYDLFLPSATRRSVQAVEGYLSLGELEQPGVYRMRGVRGQPVSRGFSVNVPASDTLLQRVPVDQLTELLGQDNFRVAQDRDEVESSVGQSRFGRELYPLMMLFVAGLFLAEQAMSNRFYKIKFSRTA